MDREKVAKSQETYGDLLSQFRKPIMINTQPSQIVNQIPAILQQFYCYLPPKPYCTDTLGFLKIRPKEQAIKDAYIQPNPITRAYWMVFDIDSPESRYWPCEWDIPTPNIEARNPENNHQHVFYMIDPAVYTLRQARQKPLKLAADVDQGLTRLLESDPGYGKLISKNPLHPHWTVYIWHNKAWGLTELIDYIPDKIKAWKPKRREIIGLGRNCTVFEVSREYAYSEWRRLRFGDAERLFEHTYDFAMNINQSFYVPMLAKEVQSITRSITKWTSRHMSATGLREWHQEQNKKSVKVRRVKATSRAEEIRAYKQEHPDVTREELSVIFDVSDFTIKGLSLSMAESRKQVQQTKATSRAEEIRAYKQEHPKATIREIANILGFGRDMVHRALSK